MMSSIVRLILAGVVAAALAAPAQAVWLRQKSVDDPFLGGAEHLAMAVEIGFTAGFRCSSRGDLTLLFVVPEKPDPTDAGLAGKLPVKLLVVVDDAARVALDAKLETTPDRSMYRIASSDARVADVVKAAAAARRRFALAGEVFGQLMWSRAFSVAGARGALLPLIRGCGLDK